MLGLAWGIARGAACSSCTGVLCPKFPLTHARTSRYLHTALKKDVGVRVPTVSYGTEPLSVFQLAMLLACIAYSSITKGNFIDPRVVLNLK